MSIRYNVLRASLAAMERRSDVDPKIIQHYRTLLRQCTTTLTVVHHAHGPHYCPSTVCDCYYGLVS